jgi:hypothetical protein
VGFLTTLALAVAVLVVAPYLAHRLRRRRAEEQPFPPARWVDPAPPRARRRSRLEDRALFATRAASIAALALLGATPFVRCSRLSLTRTGGASVALAIVLDDSMSMRAELQGRSRFERARAGARELLDSAREGDAAALVLAGAPPRVVLAATTDLRAVRRAIAAAGPSDRGTDLEGAVALARGVVGSLPQVDRRVVVLSDLADGQPAAGALPDSAEAPVWVALPELAGDLPDCAILRADQRGSRVSVAVACGPGKGAGGRDIVVEDASGKELGRANLGGGDADVTLSLSSQVQPARARLTGVDAVAADDVAPVVSEATRNAVAIAADPVDELVATGGPPVVEQALRALKLDVEAAPLPAVPDRAEDLAADLGLVADDPPGLTPEQRKALGAFVQGGGVVLLALGPHAAAAPLGATFEPFLANAAGWSETSQHGAAPASAVGPLAESAAGLTELAAPRRAVLSPEDARSFEPLIAWGDGAPLVARRAMGRGELWIATLPFSVDASDFTLRPAFLALLDAWVRSAREHAAPRRTVVGLPWTFAGVSHLAATGPAGPLEVSDDEHAPRVAPPVLGTYRISADGVSETRVAAPDPRELDLRPRLGLVTNHDAASGERRTAVDVSPHVALFLLALMVLEMALRARGSAARA